MKIKDIIKMMRNNIYIILLILCYNVAKYFVIIRDIVTDHWIILFLIIDTIMLSLLITNSSFSELTMDMVKE